MSVSLTVPATETTGALSLRPWQLDDTATLVEAHRDPALRHWSPNFIADETAARQWIQAQAGLAEAGERFGFAVVECGPQNQEIGRPVGHVGVKMTSEFHAAAAEVGYWTAAETRGRGIAARALEVVSQWALGDRKQRLERLELLHAVDNEASCRVAVKCGYRLDRILAPLPPVFPTDGHLHIRDFANVGG